MRIYIRTLKIKPKQKICKDLAWCRKYNFDNDRKSQNEYTMGAMLSMLNDALRGKEEIQEPHIFILHDGKRRMGWALVEGVGLGRECHIYVPLKFRRRGYGSRLLAKAVSVCGRMSVSAHDERSSGFYKTHGLTKGEAITGRRINLKKIKKKAA
jgi:GNAT superfamily N-acetyltransferase